MADEPIAAEAPVAEAPKVSEATAPRTLTSYVEEIHLIVNQAKRDGVGPVQLLLGVAGRQGLNAWDIFLNTLDPGSKKAAGK